MSFRTGDSPRLLIAGANGQVGWELRRSLASVGSVVALDRASFDLARPDSIRAVIRDLEPVVLINAAAYTSVDKAETEPDVAMAVNGVAPAVMAEEMSRLGGILLHYSTDYVFDGMGETPWTERDAPNPLGAYGRTKLAGERAIAEASVAHVVLRTSWVYGRHGANFVRTIIRLALERDELRIVADQVGAPTWSRDLADATATIVQRLLAADIASPETAPLMGMFHLAAADRTTWHGLAQAVVMLAPELAHRRHVTVTPIGTADYPLPARRPAFSVLDTSRVRAAFGVVPRPWRQALTQCLQYD